MRELLTLCLCLGNLALPAATQTTYAVGVVPSDDASLADPVSRDAALTADQVLAMVRRAVDLVGGMSAYVPETAKVVLLKPNISIAEPSGSGVVTDARVVRAVALLVYEAAPQARIVIGEGAGGWISPALRDCTSVNYRGRPRDGFAIAGHRATVRELRGRGVDIDCFDLNFDRAYSLHPPDGGLARDEYSIAATVLDADVFINVPLAKTHGAKITAAMKNHFGILPGRLYGWSKAIGTPLHPPMPHSPRVMDEAWIDLYRLTQVDLNVLDLIAGSEAGAFEENKTQRANTIVAGASPVAVDLVAARLMGFNPDDFEFAELAWEHGIGPRTIDAVEVRGAELAPLVRRWKKAGVEYGGRGEWAEHANYGMGPRYWTLLGPLPREHAFADDELAHLLPEPGRDGWSRVVYFGHDRINLDKHYDDPVNCAVYAFTRFTMARSDSVRFWIGSDEELSLWLDGQLLYAHEGRRRHVLGMERIHGYVEAGEHRLLLRAGQGRGDFDFSFNVTEPIDDPMYAGNRYPGVRYYVLADDSPAAANRVAADDTGGDYGGPADEQVARTMAVAVDPLERSRSAPDTVLIESALGTGELFELLLAQAGVPAGTIDAATLRVLGAAPFTTTAGFRGPRGAAPRLPRLLNWLGLSYTVMHGHGRRETLKNIHGWLDMGYTPVLPSLERSGGRRFFDRRPRPWAPVTGYRQAGDRVELRQNGRRGPTWYAATGEWTGSLPGGARQSCPVLVVEPGAAAPDPRALADSIAGLALELAWPRRAEMQEDWGTRQVPVGLAQWDRWVIDWERLPLTPEWARQPTPLDQLERMGRYPFPALAGARSLAARYFRGAAEGTVGDRRQKLTAVAAGYERVVDAIEHLLVSLPREDDVGALSLDDLERLARIGEARPLLRAARDGERAAVVALASLLGRPSPPPAATDPLLRRDRGQRLLVWRAKSEDNELSLLLQDDSVHVEVLDGDDPERMDWDVEHAMPQRTGWVVAVQQRAGFGRYAVLEPPTADNGWRLRLLADFDRVRDDNEVEIAVWAVPPQ